jgi:hypothetical protein
MENQQQTSTTPQQKSPLKSTMFLFFGLGIIAIFLVFIAILFLVKKPSKKEITQKPVSSQQKFTIISTSPRNGQKNSDTGEILISFKTDKKILSPGAFTMDISPQLPYYWKFTNSYPTTSVSARVYGGLQTNTEYTVTVKNNQGQEVYSWNFTTSAQPPTSSSLLNVDKDNQVMARDFPLQEYLPYSSTDFSIDYYQKPLTLDITVKNSDVDKVKQEVNAWIISHGVDPSTHTLNYINGF